MDRTPGRGGAGLDDRSRAPHGCPHRTSEALEALILAARREYGWGAKKLLRVLGRAIRTACGRRAAPSTLSSSGTGCCTRTGAEEVGPSGSRRLSTQRPNQVWPADFKGQFIRATASTATR